MIYLDHASTTKPLPEAIESFQTAFSGWGNPSSRHPHGLHAEKTLNDARRSISGVLGVTTGSILFTSGGTEANNLAIFGAAKKSRRRHIISTTLEHPSVGEPLRELSLRGYDVTLIAPRADGRIHPDDISSAIREDTFMASCILVCNETGSVSDLAAVSRAVKSKNPDILLHTDAVQAFLHIPFTPDGLGADLVSISAHKIGGVKGSGALYIRPGVKLAPLIYGGGQEAGLRSGTEAMPAICAFKAASGAFRPPDESLRNYTLGVLEDAGAYIIPSPDAPHIVAFAPKRRIPGEVSARMLSDIGICVSAGAACSKNKKSPAAASMRLPPGIAGSILRASFSYETSKSDIDALADALEIVLARFTR